MARLRLSDPDTDEESEAVPVDDTPRHNVGVMIKDKLTYPNVLKMGAPPEPLRREPRNGLDHMQTHLPLNAHLLVLYEALAGVVLYANKVVDTDGKQGMTELATLLEEPDVKLWFATMKHQKRVYKI